MNQTLIIVGGIIVLVVLIVSIILVVVKQVFDTMQAAIGVDMADIVKSNTIQAKTNRNFDVDIKK